VPNITRVVNIYTLPKIRDDLQPSQLSAWVIFTIHQPLTVLTLPPKSYIIMSPCFRCICCIYTYAIYICVWDNAIRLSTAVTGWVCNVPSRKPTKFLSYDKVCYCARRRRRVPLFMCLFLLFIMYNIYICAQ